MKKSKISILFRFLSPFFLLVGCVLIFLGFNDKEIVNLHYDENNEIHYNVYLKENEFFDTPYIGENRTYIANLIDFINISFHYSAKFNEQLTGNVRYKYVALVRANKADGDGYYWEKEYDLSKYKTLEINDSANFAIDDEIKVDYGYYNEILGNFKKEFNIVTDGELKIMMVLDNNSTFKKVSEPVKINREISLSIPLLEQSLEVSINKDAPNENNIFTFELRSNKPIYLFYKILGITLVIAGTIGIIQLIKKYKRFKKHNLYEVTLEKILKNYDSIIANVNNLPKMDGLKRIDVSSFDELIDVYNEVRMPINYYQSENQNGSAFIIINDEIAWVYILKKDNFLKRVDNNEEKEAKRTRE